MSLDPSKPDPNWAQVKPERTSEPQPSDADIVRALVEIERATDRPPEASLSRERDQPEDRANAPLVPERSALATLLAAPRSRILIVCALAVFLALNYTKLHSLKRTSSRPSTSNSGAIDPAAQSEVEGLLARVATGDQTAATGVLERASSWVGKTERTPSSSRSIAIAINLPDLRAREAAIEATLALDGIPKNEAGMKTLEAVVATPSGRAWALFLLGAIGNRGVDPVHAAKIMGAYIDDPDLNTRAAAVNGLALLATDETIPMLLDRFRNDPSLVVEERAACGLAESGMYTHEQRMVAAATLVSWLDDSLLSSQQRTWTIQALSGISHQNFGNDSAAWRDWYQSARLSI